MPRAKAENPKEHQVLARLTRDELDVLTAVAHLEGITVNALVRRLVEQEVSRMKEHPRVLADLENRRKYQAEKSKGVIPMSAGRRRRPADTG